MIEEIESTKKLLERFEKDFKGSLNALLIIGIIVKENRVWTYQIKKRLKKITNSHENISNSSLYSLLGRLEKDYQLITSEKDESVQRRYYMPTKICKSEFEAGKNFWLDIIEMAQSAIYLLEEE